MNAFEKFLKFTEFQMTRPTNYGWFHIMFIIIILGITLYLSIFQRKCDDKKVRLICLITWIVILLFEIYKQISFSFHYDAEGVVTWRYQWYAFPFQFCSSPLYTLPFIVFLKDGKVRDAIISYSMTFVLFAGLAVFCYPNDVFVTEGLINIQTMVHHGSQVFIGIFLIVHEKDKINLKYFLSGVIVFAIMSTIAIVLDIVVPIFVKDQTFNMFFISPKFLSTLPVLSLIQPKVPYPVFLLLYLIGFSLAALIVDLIYMLVMYIIKVCTKNKTKGEMTNETK